MRAIQSWWEKSVLLGVVEKSAAAFFILSFPGHQQQPLAAATNAPTGKIKMDHRIYRFIKVLLLFCELVASDSRLLCPLPTSGGLEANFLDIRTIPLPLFTLF